MLVCTKQDYNYTTKYIKLKLLLKYEIYTKRTYKVSHTSKFSDTMYISNNY